MRLIAILFMAIAACFSCKKETGGNELDGKWKMTQYYDRNTSSFHSKPDTSMDVFLVIDGIKFTAYSGTHTICHGGYFLLDDNISFNTINPIVPNDNWTDMFLRAIEACKPTAALNCIPSKLEKPSPNQIRINTSLWMDIIFTKVR